MRELRTKSGGKRARTRSRSAPSRPAAFRLSASLARAKVYPTQGETHLNSWDFRSRLATAAVLLAVGLTTSAPTAALARDMGDRLAAPAAASTDYAAQDAQEAADAQIVQDVIAAFQRGGFEALEGQRDALVAVLDRAPASYPIEEVRSDRVILRYQSGAEMAAIMSGLRGPVSNRIEVRFNTYAEAAFLLGSCAIEARDARTAAYYLDRGLALQPGNPLLVGERHIAFLLEGKPAESLAMVDAALAGPLMLTNEDRAHLLRNRGYDLIELRRLDEAEVAYRQSLELEPGHKGALSELNYIRLAREGRAPDGPVVLTTSDKAKTEGYPAEDGK